MSGSLAGLAFGIGNAALSALTGGGVMILGPLVLTDFALPEKVGHGGSQAMTNHKLPGGARVFDTTGPDDADITFSGIFLGTLAGVEAALLDQLRQAGQPLDLFWGFNALRVIIKDASLEDSYMRCDYRVTCCVIPDITDDGAGDDDGSTGTGQPPATPDAAAQQGNGGLTRATAAHQAVTGRAAALPVPPVPPASSFADVGPGHA